MTTDADRTTLLRIARAAVAAHVGQQIGGSPPAASTHLTTVGGAFVTLHVNGELRGCIGHLEADQPLDAVVARCAVSACSADPRFPPVTGAELGAMDIEVSLLGPFEPIRGPEDVEVGRHGLVVESGFRRGLLLPQVATEWKWNAETFLAQTCRKAGLPLDAWKHGAAIWRFDAEVFGEHH